MLQCCEFAVIFFTFKLRLVALIKGKLKFLLIYFTTFLSIILLYYGSYIFKLS